MATITVRYIPKRTSAGTEYRHIDAKIKRQILDELKSYDEFYRIYRNSTDSAVQETIKELELARKELPRRGESPYGYNSMQSFTEGVLKNLQSGTQRDFSNKTCQGIEVISSIWSKLANTDNFVFTNKLSTTQSVEQANKLFTWE